MKLIIILIILIFILLYVYNITIDTFDSMTTTSSGADNSDKNWWFKSDDIELDKPIIEKNNIKLSWLKPVSLIIDEYFIVLEKGKNVNITSSSSAEESIFWDVSKKQVFTYKNNDIVINYYIGNIDDGTYKVYLMYTNSDGDVITSELDHMFEIAHDSKTQVESNSGGHSDNTEIQYDIIKDKLYEFNPIKDNYYINIY